MESHKSQRACGGEQESFCKESSKAIDTKAVQWMLRAFYDLQVDGDGKNSKSIVCFCLFATDIEWPCQNLVHLK